MIAALVAFVVIAIILLVLVNLSMTRKMEHRSDSQTTSVESQVQNQEVVETQLEQHQPPIPPFPGDLVSPVSGSIPETTESTFFPQRQDKDVDYRQALRNFARPDPIEVEQHPPIKDEPTPTSADEDYRQGLRSFANRK